MTLPFTLQSATFLCPLQCTVMNPTGTSWDITTRVCYLCWASLVRTAISNDELLPQHEKHTMPVFKYEFYTIIATVNIKWVILIDLVRHLVWHWNMSCFAPHHSEAWTPKMVIPKWHILTCAEAIPISAEGWLSKPSNVARNRRIDSPTALSKLILPDESPFVAQDAGPSWQHENPWPWLVLAN